MKWMVFGFFEITRSYRANGDGFHMVKFWSHYVLCSYLLTWTYEIA